MVLSDAFCAHAFSAFRAGLRILGGKRLAREEKTVELKMSFHKKSENLWLRARAVYLLGRLLFSSRKLTQTALESAYRNSRPFCKIRA